MHKCLTLLRALFALLLVSFFMMACEGVYEPPWWVEEQLAKRQAQQQAIQQQQRQRQQAIQQQQRQQQKAVQQHQQQAMQGRSNTCKGFGFKENTEAHAQCMFDLFKLEQSAAQSQALQSQAESNAASQRVLLQQQIDQQNFNQGIQLLQQSQQLLNPPRPTTTCQWYYATQTMRCR